MTDDHPTGDDQPRREASARFVVEGEAGRAADLREAMDTAHRSLADSLHLSYRVLQVVMIALVAIYLVSGFRTIAEGESGVATVFGAIEGNEGLAPGLRATWPAPVGGYEIFQSENREADVGGAFQPRLDARFSREQRIERARSRDGLAPGRDGSLLTEGGELAHMQLAATWEIVDPIQYARAIPDSHAEALVQLALERAAVHVAGEMSLQSLLDQPLEQLRALLRIETQSMLSALGCGIHIVDVTLPAEPEPPYFIQKSYALFDSARVSAETQVERADAKARETLIGVAGSQYETLVGLIDQYEVAVERRQEAEPALHAINAMLESSDVTGDSARIIETAHGYRSDIETTLGRDYQRFASLLPAYREHPDLVIHDRWYQAFGTVISRPDAEIVYVPRDVGGIQLDIRGLDAVQQLRHRLDLERREREAMVRDMDLENPWIREARDIQQSGPGRELRIEDDRVKGRGSP